MNYQSYSNYNNKPPNFHKSTNAQYDKGNGIEKITKNNLTVQDVYRTPFLFLQEHHKNYKNIVNTALKGIQIESELSKLFFSDNNIKRIQKMLKKEVYNKTNKQFKLDVDQEIKDLVIAMRAIYLEHARFLPGQTVRQCKQLNKKVIDEITPGVITEVKQYYGYLKEINKPLEPIPRPMNVNNAGRRNLPSITSVWSL